MRRFVVLLVGLLAIAPAVRAQEPTPPEPAPQEPAPPAEPIEHEEEVIVTATGAGAMGGVINLVARRPQDDPIREVLFNQSSVGATDVVGFFSG